MINYANVEIVYDKCATLGEGPVWDDRRQKLFWINSMENKACILDPKTKTNIEYELGQNVGTLVLTEDDNKVLVGLVDGIYELDLTTKKLTFKVNPEPDCPNNRLNDGKADAKGRIWVGSMKINDNGVPGFDTKYECNLHVVDENFVSRVADEQVRLSNGIAWTQDNKKMYYVDSPTKTIFSYDFDLAKGEISNKKPCITVPDEFGVGDGMDIDKDGNLWVAHWGGYCVGHWNPNTGELLGKIEVPVNRVASCTFGGENYDELYIVTASVNKELDSDQQPDAGKVFVAKNIGTNGFAFNRFK